MQALVKCSLGIAHNKMACPSVNPYGFVQEVTRVSHDKVPEILWLGGAATMKDFCRDLIHLPLSVWIPPNPFILFNVSLFKETICLSVYWRCISKAAHYQTDDLPPHFSKRLYLYVCLCIGDIFSLSLSLSLS